MYSNIVDDVFKFKAGKNFDNQMGIFAKTSRGIAKIENLGYFPEDFRTINSSKGFEHIFTKGFIRYKFAVSWTPEQNSMEGRARWKYFETEICLPAQNKIPKVF